MEPDIKPFLAWRVGSVSEIETCLPYTQTAGSPIQIPPAPHCLRHLYWLSALCVEATNSNKAHPWVVDRGTSCRYAGQLRIFNKAVADQLLASLSKVGWSSWWCRYHYKRPLRPYDADVKPNKGCLKISLAGACQLWQTAHSGEGKIQFEQLTCKTHPTDNTPVNWWPRHNYSRGIGRSPQTMYNTLAWLL